MRIPHAETQMATVTRNDDPKGSGRIQVRMNWQADDMNTNWIRVMTPDAGRSGDVKSNRGFVFIPEVGDHVLVGFRHGDPSRPYAMGSLFNGFTGKGGGPKNSIKSLRTRSGISVILNDDNRSLEIKDAGGSSIHLDGNGNILLNAPKNIQLHAGNDMSLMAGHDLQVNIGNSQTTNIGNMLLTNVMQKILVNTPFMQQLVADFFHTQAGKALLNSQNQIKIEAPETNVVGEQELFIHSANKTVVNSQGTMEMRGEQGMHELNTAKEYETVKEEIGTKVCVQFRTTESYSGEFGFDRVRFADSERTGDIEENRYDKIIGTCEDEGENFKQDTGRYKQFLFEYKHQHIIPWKKKEAEAATLNTGTNDGKKTTDYLYVVPVMTLLKGQCADLTLNIDVHKKAQRLEYEYDKDFFTLNQSSVPILDIGHYPSADDLSITCNKEFPEDKEICLYAYDEQGNKSLAGKLIVKANDEKHRYALDVVMVNVKTCIKDDNLSSPPPNPSRKTTLQKYFSQCYIDANIEECELDLTTPDQKEAFLAYTDEELLKREDLSNLKIYDYLTSVLSSNPDTAKYASYYKIYFINENADGDSSLYGRAREICSKEVIVLSPGLDDTTCAHELFHALGLYHSFSDLNLHTF
ncbi:MAG: phage baseplate assembly protein V, partial [Phocaeicola sp.]|uniref:phage baseplate assembly protein V n=1 Tax=Phocaeicola sp. TaxID=2773926 RepID=UPI003F9EF048